MDKNHGGNQSVDSLQETKEEEARGRTEGEDCKGEEEKPMEKIRLQAEVSITIIQYFTTTNIYLLPNTFVPLELFYLQIS